MRFDSVRFYEAVEQRRQDEKLSWRQLASQLSLSPSTFSRMGQGRRPDVDTFVKLLAWLQRPAEDFMTEPVSAPKAPPPQDTVRQIANSLRDDPALTREDAAALEQIVRVAYHRLRGT